MQKRDLFFHMNKMCFSPGTTFKQRLKIRDILQYKFSEYIFTLNSENDLIIRKSHNASSCSRTN